VPASCFTTLALHEQRHHQVNTVHESKFQIPELREHRNAPEECISCSVLEVPCLIVLAPVSAPAMLAAPVAELALREHGITASTGHHAAAAGIHGRTHARESVSRPNQMSWRAHSSLLAYICTHLAKALRAAVLIQSGCPCASGSGAKAKVGRGCGAAVSDRVGRCQLMCGRWRDKVRAEVPPSLGHCGRARRRPSDRARAAPERAGRGRLAMPWPD
jgi:hypothetical protein